MPLHVNLYHEIQRQEIARQRDPLRLGLLAILLIAIGFAVNYFVILERAHSVGVRYTDVQGVWTALEPKAKDAKAKQDELNNEIQASDALRKTVDGRFDWAPILQEILKTTPREVQLTRVAADMPDDEKVTSSHITISGISGAVEPRKEAEAVRTALEARLAKHFKHVSSAFKELDDSDQFVLLDGHRLATAGFTIEYQVQLRDAVAAATPAPARRARKEASE